MQDTFSPQAPEELPKASSPSQENQPPGQVTPDAPQPASVLPGSFQQPGQPGSQQKAQKRQRTWRIIAAGELLLVLIVGSLGFLVIPSSQTEVIAGKDASDLL